MSKRLPSQSELNEMLTFDAESGVLVWKTRPLSTFATKRAWSIWNSRFVGKPAGSDNGNGYIKVSIKGEDYRAHRLVWMMAYGVDPLHIDHVNGDRSDNRLCNLRSVTQAENNRNMKLYSCNKSGHAGVDRVGSRGKWRASIRIEGRTRHIGYFGNFEEAVAARKAAEIGCGFHPNHGKKVLGEMGL